MENQKLLFKWLVRNTISVVTLFVVSLASLPVSAWGVRYFNYTEEDPYGFGTSLTPFAERDWWDDYYRPTRSVPAPPNDFLSTTSEECQRFCKHDPYPFSKVEDCEKVCRSRSVIADKNYGDCMKCYNPNSQSCPPKCTGHMPVYGCEVECKNYSPFKDKETCLSYCDKGNEAYQLPTTKVKAYKGHNWLTNYAIHTLRQLGLWENNISNEDLMYIHYGLTIADFPWLGRPEKTDPSKDYVVGIWDLENDDLRERNYTDDDYYVSENEYYRTEAQWKGGTFKGADSEGRSNFYLMARQRAKNGKLVNEDQRNAADNYFHFPNGESPGNGNILLRTSSKLFDKDPVFRNSDVGASRYGTVLYQLARQFWPQNAGRPDIRELPYFYSRENSNANSTNGLTGVLTLDHCGGVADHEERASYPSLYLGGNPFVCTPVDNTPPVNNPSRLKTTDLCRYGDPTWPIWVPSDLEFIPSPYQTGCFWNSGCGDKLTQSCLINAPCVTRYHEKLKERYPDKSKRAALIYLGWAAHMIQDLAMPRHAANWQGKTHGFVEKLADAMIRQGYGDKGGFADWGKFDEQVENIFGSNKTRYEICENLDLNDYSSLENDNVRVVFDDVREDAYDDRNEFSKKDNFTNRRYIQVAFQRSIIATMKLLACFNYNECDSELVLDSLPKKATHRAKTISTTAPLDNDGEVRLLASQSIVLSPGFQAPSGSYFRAAIQPCQE